MRNQRLAEDLAILYEALEEPASAAAYLEIAWNDNLPGVLGRWPMLGDAWNALVEDRAAKSKRIDGEVPRTPAGSPVAALGQEGVPQCDG